MYQTLRIRRIVTALCLLVLLSIEVTSSSSRATSTQLRSIQSYIKQSWRTLTRSNSKLADAAVDPKFKPASGGRWPVFVSATEDLEKIDQQLRSELTPEARARIELRRLPSNISQIQEQGLLY